MRKPLKERVLEIKLLDEKGRGVIDKHLFCLKTLPGELIQPLHFVKKKRDIIIDDFVLKKSSKKRITQKCKYFNSCGGCSFQHLSYEDQLNFKKNYLIKLLRDFWSKDIAIIPSEKIYGYRNRIDLTINNEKKIGFRKRFDWKSVLDIEECSLFGDSSRRVISAVRKLFNYFSGWDIVNHYGDLRYLVLREGKNTKELQLNLIFSRDLTPSEKEILINNLEFVDSLYFSINDSLSDVSMGNPFHLYNKEFITEKLLNTSFLIHPNSFFQTNTFQAENMLREIYSLIKEISPSKILDLYSGVGTFSIFLAKKGFIVKGVEINSFSVEMAKRNAELNNVDIDFILSPSESIDKSLFSFFDLLIVDPPRTGLHPKLIKKINNSSINYLIYISCNPKTFKRDLELLSFDIESIKAIDMFPQTPHVELVALVKKKQKIY